MFCLFNIFYFFFDVAVVFFPLVAEPDFAVLGFLVEEEEALGAAFFGDEAAAADFARLAFFAAVFGLAAGIEAAVFALEVELDDRFGVTSFSTPVASIAEAAAPTTAPLAAPDATSPITSVAL
ncbi:MAG: hypothetical protein ABI999_04130 [Acidobacteriota bacterium]